MTVLEDPMTADRVLPLEHRYPDNDHRRSDPKLALAHLPCGSPVTTDFPGAARMLVPHPYSLEERQVGAGLRLASSVEPGFWETLGHHNYRDPWQEQRYWGD
jgi:DMSO/TMAO reductase YedYZ molybdopterin-dependent catalytic subunit